MLVCREVKSLCQRQQQEQNCAGFQHVSAVACHCACHSMRQQSGVPEAYRDGNQFQNPGGDAHPVQGRGKFPGSAGYIFPVFPGFHGCCKGYYRIYEMVLFLIYRVHESILSGMKAFIPFELCMCRAEWIHAWLRISVRCTSCSFWKLLQGHMLFQVLIYGMCTKKPRTKTSVAKKRFFTERVSKTKVYRLPAVPNFSEYPLQWRNTGTVRVPGNSFLILRNSLSWEYNS